MTQSEAGIKLVKISFAWCQKRKCSPNSISFSIPSNYSYHRWARPSRIPAVKIRRAYSGESTNMTLRCCQNKIPIRTCNTPDCCQKFNKHIKNIRSIRSRQHPVRNTPQRLVWPCIRYCRYSEYAGPCAFSNMIHVSDKLWSRKAFPEYPITNGLKCTGCRQGILYRALSRH